MKKKITYDDFRNFLKEHHCELEFDLAFYEQNGCTGFDTALWDTAIDAARDARNLFGCVFKWSKTAEGIQFWRAMDLMWYDFCK